MTIRVLLGLAGEERWLRDSFVLRGRTCNKEASKRPEVRKFDADVDRAFHEERRLMQKVSERYRAIYLMIDYTFLSMVKPQLRSSKMTLLRLQFTFLAIIREGRHVAP